MKNRFLLEHRNARQLEIPDGYSFSVNGTITQPNLMQLHFASLAAKRPRLGNWSGTGAGKTLSAILATRITRSKLTVVCCPNSVVAGWCEAITAAFPASEVIAKTFKPKWKGTSPRYLVLNYELLQQHSSVSDLIKFLNQCEIDFIIIDEIHFTKQRTSENLSKRRELIGQLVHQAGESNCNLHVIGMTATPVINNLNEGKSLIELITGLAHEDLKTNPTISNCISLHQTLVTVGIRWKPEYHIRCEEIKIAVDCVDYLSEIRALGNNGSPFLLEQILTKARLPAILSNIKPKTLLYTYNIGAIDGLLHAALSHEGWKVGFFTGDDKSGLDSFINGDLDVLIASSAISTGVDKLQHVCNRLIVNVLPWTSAEYEQLKGRIFRQGQKMSNVEIILPMTYANINGTHWSWCESKMNRLNFKSSIADAAVDGVVPEGQLRSPSQAYMDIMSWLARLDAGEVRPLNREKLKFPDLESACNAAKPLRKFGTFSTINGNWNQSSSGKTHDRLQKDPEEWTEYHALYREARKTWAVIPFEELIKWYQKRSNLSIADFGCGEAKLAETLSESHTVYSFDHVAINDKVIACDMKHVPLDDEVLDGAVFSLSLMGDNFIDYLREAHRTLKLDGHIHIIESTKRFKNREQFADQLKYLGFDVLAIEDIWKFTHIRALKADRKPRPGSEISF